jgi:hypothetical protein
VVRRKKWPTNLWYAKIDFAQAFFNINIHPKSKMVTGFQVNGVRYQFRYMPFGISIAPFVCQTLLNAIIETIKKDTPYVWGHIDDVIIAAKSRRVLQSAIDKLIIKLELAGWKLNKAKCELKPVRNLTFLGARWGRTGIKRQANTTRSIVNVIKAIPRLKTLKQQQQAAGFLQYYLSFAGNCSRAIQLAFENPAQANKLIKLAKKAFLKFKPSRTAKSALVYSDATPGRLGAIVQGIGYTKTIEKSHINVDELKAAIYDIREEKNELMRK